MQTAPEITIDDIPIQECVNYGGSINDSGSGSGSGSDSGSDFEQSSQSDLLSELEVIITFLKCKSHLFKYSADYVVNYCRLAYVATLFLSGTITVLPLLVSYEKWLLIIISILGAFTTGITIAGKHANFDNTIQKYNSISTAYTTLENEMIVFKSINMYTYDKYRILYDKIREIETKIMELKCTVVEIPSSVQPRFVIISNIDIFSCIHKIENDRKLLTNRISSIRYEIRRMVADIESVNQDVKQKMRLKFLFDSKKKIKDELENINYAKIITEIEMERKTHSKAGWLTHL